MLQVAFIQWTMSNKEGQKVEWCVEKWDSVWFEDAVYKSDWEGVKLN